MLTALLTLIGVIIGCAVTVWIHRLDSKQRLLIAMAGERFRISQEAYQRCQTLKHVIHGDERIRNEVLQEAREWLTRNNLYLPPDIRNDLDLGIKEVWDYRDNLREFYRIRSGGDDTKTAEARAELKSRFQFIMGLDKRIQDSLDVYYQLETFSVLRRLADIAKLFGILFGRHKKVKTD